MSELTILMPCLNEEENIAFCIEQAQKYLSSRNLSGEILVVDNDSTDRSAEIATAHGATVIKEHRRGYGRALRTGLAAAQGDVIIFGDCDSTYDWHCGIRGIRKDALQKLNLQTNGMEFATEMIAEASRKGLLIGEVSVPLKKAQNERQEKLRTIRDGFRHLWYIVKA